MAPRKRTTESHSALAEPTATPGRRVCFGDGLEHFDAGRYWDAHEAWEQAWRELGDGPEDDGELVLRGLIQLAAALHGAALGRDLPAARNLAKAAPKLACSDGRLWGLDVTRLNRRIGAACGDPGRLLGAALPRLP